MTLITIRAKPGHRGQSRLFPSKEELSRLYWEEGLSMSQIAQRFDVCREFVKKMMVKMNINRRSRGESSRIALLGKIQVGPQSPVWKGGRYKTSGGYIIVTIYNDDPFFCMGGRCRGPGKRILEHRLVMANKLGRPLLPIETVHHINGVKDDNRPENLKLFSRADHTIYKDMCAHCELRKEIRLLRWQIKELTAQIQGRLLPDGDRVHA